MAEASFAVIDLETTGFNPNDRVVEIGLIHVDANGQIERRWQTLIQPGRDIPNTHVHGISATDVVDAPRFGQIAAELAALLQSRIIVAHNATFDLSFLKREFSRLGLELDLSISSLCTMVLSQTHLPGGPRKLSDCLFRIGVTNVAPHAALADTEATAQLFTYMLPSIGVELRSVWPCAIPWHHFEDEAAEPVARDDHRTEPGEWLRRISSSLPGTGDRGRDSYRRLLNAALADDELTDTEIQQLLKRAEELGMNRAEALEEHELYVRQLAVEAWADGEVTSDEQETLRSVATALGVDQLLVYNLLTESLAGGPRERIVLKPGDRVAFTGATELPREAWEARAVGAGLNVGGVTQKSVLLMAANPDSRSGKAQRAIKWDVPVVSEMAFARLIRELEESPVTSAPELSTVPFEYDDLAIEYLRVFPWMAETADTTSGPQSIASAWISRYPARPLFEMSPRLSATFTPEFIEHRTAAIRQWIARYPEPLRATIVHLGDLPGVGKRRLEEMTQQVVMAALDATGADEYSQFGELIEYDVAEAPTLLIPPALQTMWHWWILTGAEMDLQGAPILVAEAFDEARDSPDVENIGRSLWNQAFDELTRFAAGDPRLQLIVQERLLGDSTLEELGVELGVTRERVRQLEKPLRERAGSIGTTIDMILASLGQRFRPFAKVEDIYAALPQLRNPSPFEGDSLLNAITGLSTDFEIDGLWWQHKDTGPLILENLSQASDEFGIVDPEELATRLGVGRELLLERLTEPERHRIGIYQGLILTSINSYGDRAAAVLHLEGQPMTTPDLIDRLPGGNVRSLGNALSIDERFTRSALDTWSLTSWGYEEFTTISGHIAKRIEENGGAYSFAALLEEAGELRVSQSSLRTFAANGEYSITDGIISKADAPVENTALPEETKALYYRDGAWNLLVTVSFDHLRGSGLVVCLSFG